MQIGADRAQCSHPAALQAVRAVQPRLRVEGLLRYVLVLPVLRGGRDGELRVPRRRNGGGRGERAWRVWLSKFVVPV